MKLYIWLHRFQDNGIDGLENRKPTPTVAWNQIPLDHRDAIIEPALDKPEFSPRELAVHYTDQREYFVSEPTLYRLSKAQDLITNPACLPGNLMTAAIQDIFRQCNTRKCHWHRHLPLDFYVSV